MIDSLPLLRKFSRLYWGQMGDDVYGSIDRAFTQMLDDASRLNDGGVDFYRKLLGELISVHRSTEYSDWVSQNFHDVSTIKKVGGRFIWPDEIEILLNILKKKMARSHH